MNLVQQNKELIIAVEKWKAAHKIAESNYINSERNYLKLQMDVEETKFIQKYGFACLGFCSGMIVITMVFWFSGKL